MSNKLKKNLIITNSLALGVAAIGVTTALVSCKNDNTEEIKNITFTNESITNLKDSLISLVDDKQLTREEFSANLLENIKDNFIVNNEKIGNSITKAILTNQNIIQLTLNNKNFEYLLDPNFDNNLATLNQNLLSIQLDVSNSSFYQEISFNSGVLEGLRNDIVNKINNGEITGSNIESKIVDLINNIKTNDNKNLSEYISTPTYSSNSINITLKNDIGKYKFKNINNIPDILITSNSINLSNMSLPEAPLDWFNLNGNEVISLTEEGKKQKSIILPAKTTSISNNVFLNNTTIQSVDMSLTGITTIPNGAVSVGLFYGCSNLTSINIPNSVTSIGAYAFRDCSSLTSINIPDGVTSIGRTAFYNCSSLTSIKLPNNLTSIESFVFGYCSSLTEITIPNSVTSIGAYAFRDCSSLTSIKLPNNLTSIGNYAFYNCSSLTSINIPNSVTSIEDYAFTNVKQVNVPNSDIEKLVKDSGYTGTINIIQ